MKDFKSFLIGTLFLNIFLSYPFNEVEQHAPPLKGGGWDSGAIFFSIIVTGCSR